MALHTEYRIELSLKLRLRSDSIFALDECVAAIKRTIRDVEVAYWDEERLRVEIPESQREAPRSVVREEKTNG